MMNTKKIKLECIAVVNPNDKDCEYLPIAYRIPEGVDVISLEPCGIDIASLEVSEVLQSVPAYNCRSERVENLFCDVLDLSAYGANIVYLLLYYPEFKGFNENGIPCYAVIKGDKYEH